MNVSDFSSCSTMIMGFQLSTYTTMYIPTYTNMYFPTYSACIRKYTTCVYVRFNFSGMKREKRFAMTEQIIAIT